MQGQALLSTFVLPESKYARFSAISDARKMENSDA